MLFVCLFLWFSSFTVISVVVVVVVVDGGGDGAIVCLFVFIKIGPLYMEAPNGFCRRLLRFNWCVLEKKMCCFVCLQIYSAFRNVLFDFVVFFPFLCCHFKTTSCFTLQPQFLMDVIKLQIVFLRSG